MRVSTVVTVLVFFGIAAFVTAHGDVPFTSPNTIHACRNQNTGALRQISTGTCANGEAIVHWNITGPAGANGTNGINGTNGTNGIDGINGTNGTNGINAVEPSHPDPPCVDNSNRYVDCGNGTVTDTVTDLIWLKDDLCLGQLDWIPANQAAASLKEGDCSLADHSSAGDWRLPTASEWSATIEHAVVRLLCASDNSATLTNDRGTGCYRNGAESSFVDLATSYWSSSTSDSNGSSGAFVFLTTGEVSAKAKVNASFRAFVWPVRSGHR